MSSSILTRTVLAGLIVIGITACSVTSSYGQKTDLKVINDQAISLPYPNVNWDFKGVVKVHVTVDENGRVTSAKATPDSYFLFVIQCEIAAKKAVFPNKRTEGLLVYTFPPAAASNSPAAMPSPSPVKATNITDEYFTNIKNVTDLSDVKSTDAFYDDLKFLIEKEVAFGYADKKFHGEMPVTRGDLAYGVGRTIELMARRLAMSDIKIDRLCPQYKAVYFKDVPIGQITDLKSTQPYYSEVKKMAEEYHIYFYDPTPALNSFNGSKVVTHNQFRTMIIEMFPSHGLVFTSLKSKLPNDDQPLTRGEFVIQLSRLIDLVYSSINNNSSDDDDDY